MIVLVGFMGAGKTTIGHMLAERLGLPFVDSDLVIERRQGLSIRQIFDEHGEPAFRQIEHGTLVELLAGEEAVLALGGGAVEKPETRQALRGHTVVYLHVDFPEAMARVGQDEYRPLLHAPGLDRLFDSRLPQYEAAADVVVKTTGRRAEAVVMDLLARLTPPAAERAGRRSILVAPTGGTYRVHVGPGLHRDVDALLPDLPHTEQAFVCHTEADAVPAAAVADGLRRRGLRVHCLPLPSGKSVKSLDAVGAAAGQLADRAAHRQDLVVAVGGEDLCDAVGFLASIYNRGMPLALTPTTLVAQADSAVGGKNGVNLPHAPNLLGAIHQPIGVLCDVELAVQRREDGWQDGLAELAKHALIREAAAPLRSLLRESPEAVIAGDIATLCDAVSWSVEIKAEVVTNDECEHGERVHLNYGHTFAHALEQVAGPTPGAVSIGMMAEAHLAEALGLLSSEGVQEQRALLEGLRLPVTADLDLPAMRQAWLRDKKYRRGVRFVLLEGIGHPVTGVTVDDASLATALTALRT